MSAYLAPGVYVEEQNFRPASIAGLSTSVAGMVGPTRTGPIRGRPLLLTSFTDYETYFGDALNLSLGGASVTNYTAYAAKAFFDNGGQQLYLARIANDVVGEGNASQRPATASLVLGSPALATITARFPGSGGNVDLVLQPRRSQKLLSLTTPGPADTVLLNLTAVPEAAILGVALPAATTYPLQKLTGVATHTPANGGVERYVFAANTQVSYVDAGGNAATVPFASVGTAIAATAVPAGSAQAVAVGPAGASAGTLYSVPVGSTMRTVFGVPATVATLYGTVSGATATFTKALNPALAADVAVPVAVLATGTRAGDGNLYYDLYDISVQSSGLEIYRFTSVDLQQGNANDLGTALTATPVGDAVNAQPVAASYDGSVAPSALWGALLAAFDPALLAPAAPATSQFVLHLKGGTDGVSPQTADYAGQTDEINGDFGLAAFEAIDEISIVLCPAAAAADALTLEGVVLAVQVHCTKMLYRVGVIDPPPNSAIADVQSFRAQFSDTRLALYYPWVEAASLAPGGGGVMLPPSGFIAGIYANTDLTRGVHKAPANEVVLGALALQIYVNTAQQGILNPLGINCIRSFPNRGILVWGGRTLSDDPNWQYVNVRRYFLYLEHSISHATNWVVFEPNGPELWSSISASVSDFLYNEWANRRLFGLRPENAFFVRCDGTTMTQNDLDNGRLVCVIGAAPLEPAEFVIFRIGQMTASS